MKDQLKPLGENTEAIYDEQISPLMVQIIKICKENGIPTFCAFQLTNEETEEAGPLWCSTTLPCDGMDEKITKLHDIIKGPQHKAFTITTTKADGSIVMETIIS